MLLLGKDSAGTGAKAIENDLGPGGIEQHDAFDLGTQRAHLAQDLGSVAGLIVEIVAENDDIDGDTEDCGKEVVRV